MFNLSYARHRHGTAGSSSSKSVSRSATYFQRLRHTVMVLSMALDQGRIKSGDRIVLAGIGSGINCMVGEVIW